MLIYEKYVTETVDNEEVKVRHLFGTEANVPSDSDNQLVYQDADGDAVTPTLAAQYFDDGKGGIIMLTEEDEEKVETFLAVNINKGTTQSPNLVNVIPGGSYKPADKVLKSIRFKTKPTKLAYVEGDEINITGAVIEATWETGDKSIVANTDCTFTPAGALATTDNKITASYTYPAIGESQVTKTANCTITVEAAPIDPDDNSGT